ncbi:hypothetical protein C7446_2530 [Kushneria sinocarnis]|uniref:Uncharacterized protein n=1 Tax=Kushneria sinocarnis TaxID=595502 RepID=A0A420WUI9_9GAMM|nr:hypothetical protein [Kushneria sinocarnis]RKQ97111.1 hypothetical protein C7446_2530 [Kushneria sinocarnis]
MKVKLKVTEILSHSLTVDIDCDEYDRLLQVDEYEAAEMIGDRMGQGTIKAGRWEDPEIDVIDE